MFRAQSDESNTHFWQGKKGTGCFSGSRLHTTFAATHDGGADCFGGEHWLEYYAADNGARPTES